MSAQESHLEMAQRAMYDTFAYHDVNVPKFDALMQ